MHCIVRSLRIDPSKLLLFSLCWVLFVACLPSCAKKDGAIPSVSDLRLSVDSICFDSVFLTEVSPTHVVRVYNLTSHSIVIPRLALQGGSQSQFSLLIDGAQTTEAQDVRIEGRDSLTILARVRPISTTVTTERLHDELVLSLRDGGKRSVRLLATGLAHNDVGENDFRRLNALLQEAPKTPLLITRTVEVPKGETLYIPAGVKLYFRPQAGLRVYGSLVIEGVPKQHALLAGERLDTAYRDTPGQWLGISLMPGSGPHRIKNATIRAAVTAIRTDSVQRLSVIENSIVRGSSRDAMVFKRSNFLLRGCIFTQNSGAAVAVAGSRLSLIHCSLNGMTRFGQSRRSALISLEKPPQGTQNQLSVINSIVWGNYEVEFRSYDTERFANEIVTLSHSLIRWGSQRPPIADHWEGVIYSPPQWENASKHDLALKSSSPARGTALVLEESEDAEDINGFPRLHGDGTVDMGALVWDEVED